MRLSTNFARMQQCRTTKLDVRQLEARDVPTTYDLGVAAEFNVFMFEEMTVRTSDVEGRVAVGGKASFYAYGIGDKLPNSNGTRDDLIVGQDLEYTYGQVFFGNIVYGGAADLEGVGTPNGAERQQANVLDFATARSELTTMSDVLGDEGPNGRTRLRYSTLALRGRHPELNIFSVTADELAHTRSLNIMVPFGSTVVVNVSGAAVDMRNMGLRLRGVDCSLVLWNFHEAEQLSINGVGLRGSVLAPDADMTFNNGNIEGTVVAESMTGNGQFNLCASEVSIEIPDEATLQGMVFVDENGDNQLGDEESDAGIAGVLVQLTGTDSLGRDVNLERVTQDGGLFGFDGLWPGTFTVRVIPPQKYEESALLGIPGTVDGSVVGTGAINQVTTIGLNEGDDGIDYLLPLLPTPD